MKRSFWSTVGTTLWGAAIGYALVLLGVTEPSWGSIIIVVVLAGISGAVGVYRESTIRRGHKA